MTLTFTCGRTTIVTVLHGEVTPERLDRERRIIEHRAFQLDEYKAPKRPMFELHPREEWNGKDDELKLGRKR